MTSYLARLDATPAAQKWPTVRQWMRGEPRLLFEEVRAFRPILETPGATLITRYQDVVEVLLRHDVFTGALYRPKMGDHMLGQDDSPSHYRDKAVMRTILNREDLPKIRSFVGERAAAILAGADGEIDAVSDVARAVPIALVQEWFGFEGSDPGKLSEWSYWNQVDGFHNHPYDDVEDPDAIVEKRVRALEEMKGYLVALIQRRFAQMKEGKAGDDMLWRLLRTRYPESVGFGLEQIVLNTGGLLIGAVETTQQAVVQVLAELLERPDVLTAASEAAAGEDPIAVDGYVWEALRYRPITPYLFRMCESRFVMARGTDAEQRIEPGTYVLPIVISANFDPSQFPDPEKFDHGRPTGNRLTFGLGLHECLGRYIGGVMIPEIVRQFLRLPNLRADGPIDYRGGAYPEAWTVRWGG